MQEGEDAQEVSDRARNLKLAKHDMQLTPPADANTSAHLNTHHDAQVDTLLGMLAGRREARKALADFNITHDSRLLRPGGAAHVITTKRQRNEHTRLQAVAYRGVFCAAGVCPAPVCNCESPHTGWGEAHFG